MINTAEQGEQAGSQTEWVWKQTGKDSTSPPQSLQTSHGETEACLHSAATNSHGSFHCVPTPTTGRIFQSTLSEEGKQLTKPVLFWWNHALYAILKCAVFFFFFPQRFPGARAVCIGLWHMLPRCVLPIKLMTGWITLVLNLIFSEIGLGRINKTPSSNS